MSRPAAEPFRNVGLVELTDDDRVVLYGVFLWKADKLRNEDGANAFALRQRKGKWAFAAEALPAADQLAIDSPWHGN